eukprot:1624125-Pyramimonas_sp.AAC.1
MNAHPLSRTIRLQEPAEKWHAVHKITPSRAHADSSFEIGCPENICFHCPENTWLRNKSCHKHDGPTNPERDIDMWSMD